MDKENTKKFKSKYVLFIVLAIIILFIAIVLISAFFCKYNKEQKNGLLDQENNKIKIYENEFAGIPKMNFYGDVLTLQTKKETSNIIIDYSIGDETVFKSNATIKLQGTSSLAYDKKNYTINLYTDDTFSKKNKIELYNGWGAQSKYCLKANWIDSTHSRNIVSARLMAKVQEKYDLFKDCPNNGLIDGYPIEIYINDEYHGLYTCNIPKDEWMFNMDSKNPNHIVMCAESNNEGSSSTFNCEAIPIDGYDWSIEVGPKETDEEVQETFEKLNRVIRFVMNSSDEEFKNSFNEYLNLDACLNYLSFLYTANCIDNVAKNMLLVTYDGQVWYPSMYDLDSTWGLETDGLTLYSVTNEFPNEYLVTSLLWERILTCFPKEFKNRYTELKRTVLSNKNIISAFKEFDNSISSEMWTREHEKWTNIPSISYTIDQIYNYAKERSTYLNSVIKEI